MATIESTGMLTKGIKLSYKLLEDFVVLEDLQEVPDLGGDTETVEVTTLANGSKRYIKGLKDYGELEFGFLYGSGAGSSFKVLQGLEAAGEVTEFQVELPDGTTITFSADVSLKINAMAVGEAMTFAAVLALNSEMVFA